MPRMLMDVSQEWFERLQRVLPAAIDTLTGLEHQLETSALTNAQNGAQLSVEVKGQLADLRRNLESIYHIF